MKDFLTGLSSGSDGDLLHLSEGSSDMLGLLDMEIENNDEEDKND